MHIELDGVGGERETNFIFQESVHREFKSATRITRMLKKKD